MLFFFRNSSSVSIISTTLEGCHETASVHALSEPRRFRPNGRQPFASHSKLVGGNYFHDEPKSNYGKAANPLRILNHYLSVASENGSLLEHWNKNGRPEQKRGLVQSSIAGP
ncbi:hypothetical protein AVEN_51885-1 [Araneus ventricosus]|uniref:Uncharacterized protein n=1 Tax=Araneus ventricosus TaxID=182803 RepID=A0A4Y2JJG0_ARAVE|nr:hypothetical protein AVEN_51885-1 [Araneus ventricosus]